jgi:2-polyprenyl-3-methyl-5-hydroxy-6-metoxy-1,4-benzoquinol methylase
MPKPVHAIRLKDPILEDLALPPASVVLFDYPGAIPESKAGRFALILGNTPLTAELGARVRGEFEAKVGEKGMLLLETHAPFDARAIAAFRNAMWPAFHVFRAYRVQNQQYVDRLTADGWEKLTKHFVATWSGTAIAAMRRSSALAPDSIVTKFNKNAAGWSGDPKSPLFAHHRWMRKLVSDLGEPKAGERTLDAGCGAGWVGIEAAKKGAQVFAFDPSPEMVKFTNENAAKEGVKLEAQAGFVEKPPWSEPFSLVLNSGVVSFAPDAEKYLASLDALVAKGGRLVIGDLNPLSRGMAKRRAEEAILPIRELNALPRAEIEKALTARGYRLAARRYYQLTDPVP